MKDFFTKDNMLGIFMALFFSLMGSGAAYGFEASIPVGMIMAVVGGILGCIFKEVRRGQGEVRPKNFLVPYAIGTAIGLVLSYFMGVASEAALAAG